MSGSSYTPGYELDVVCDYWLPGAVRPPIIMEKNAHELGKNIQCKKSGVYFEKFNNSWEILGYNQQMFTYSDVQTPASTVTPGLLDPLSLVLALDYQSIAAAGPSDLPSDITPRPSGFAGFKKRVSASSGDYIRSLDDDVSSYPGPTAWNQGKQVERCCKTSTNWSPLEGWAVLFVDAKAVGQTNKVRRVLHPGPIWSTSGVVGNGSYAVTVNDEGALHVEALLSTDGGSTFNWTTVHSQKVTVGGLNELLLKGSVATTISGGQILVYSASDAGATPGQGDNPPALLTNMIEEVLGFAEIANAHIVATVPVPALGSTTTITSGTTSATQTVGSTAGMVVGGSVTVGTLTDNVITAIGSSTSVTFSTSITTTTGMAVNTPQGVPQPLRIEVGSNERPRIHVFQYAYPASGYLEDVFVLAGPRSTSDTLYVRTYTATPSDSSVTIEVWDNDTNTSITPGTPTTGSTYTDTPFTPLSGSSTSYRIRFTLNSSSDTFVSPSLFKAGLYAGSAIDNTPASAVTPFYLATIDGPGRTCRYFSVEDGGAALLGGAASYEMTDIDASGFAIRSRGNVPMYAALTGDWLASATSDTITTQTCKLWQGYSVRPTSQRMAANRKYASPSTATWINSTDNAWVTDLIIRNEAHRLTQAITQVRCPWMYSDSKTPYKVVDRIRTLLWAAYDPSLVNIADNPMTLSPAKDDMSLDPQSEIVDIIESDARDYLSSAVVWDLGQDAWVLNQPPSTLSVPLARFSFVTPPASSVYNYTSPINYYVPWMEARSRPQIAYEEPQYNCVEVYGGVAKQDATVMDNGNNVASQVQNTSGRLIQVLRRYDVCNFLSLPTTSPHYPMPLQPGGTTGTRDYNPVYAPLTHFDSTLTSPAVLDIVCLRLFLSHCFGKDVLIFQAPLIPVWNPRDSAQIRPRPLRMFDLVDVENPQTGAWETWTVRRVRVPPIKHLSATLATYELVKVAWPSDTSGKQWVGMLENQPHLVEKSRKNAKAAMGVGKSTNMTASSNKAVQANAGQMMGMAHIPYKQLQITDTSSSNFGLIDASQLPTFS